MKTFIRATLVAAMCSIAAVTFAQSTATPDINKRQMRQQARIKQGVKSGELTKGETRRLEAREAKIQKDKLRRSPMAP